MEAQELEKLTRNYQMIQEQLQAVTMQREQGLAQKEENTQAIAEIEKSAGKVFLNLGGAMVEVTKEEATERVKERLETVEMRLNILNKQHEDLSKKEKTMREDINSALKDSK